MLPRLYAIVDAGCFAGANSTAAMAQYVRELMAGGVSLIQYRNKNGSAREMLGQARELRRVARENPQPSPAPSPSLRSGSGWGNRVRLIMNDRSDLCLAASFDGVHLGQDDLSPGAARAIVGADRLVGVSTHNPEQVREADGWPVDYIAVGPVFSTTSKQNPDTVIGVEGVGKARALTRKPLVAIGGITRANCRDVIAVGADAVAVISDLLREPERAAGEFLALLLNAEN